MNTWHKSLHSPSGSDCVEVRERVDGTDVRDTQHRTLGYLTFDTKEWAALVSVISNGIPSCGPDR